MRCRPDGREIVDSFDEVLESFDGRGLLRFVTCK